MESKGANFNNGVAGVIVLTVTTAVEEAENLKRKDINLFEV
jgi:hypothetical protein